MRLALGACALLLALAPITQAQELPRYERGQAFVFDNGRVERVVEVEGDRVTWAGRSGRTYVRDRNPIVPTLEWVSRGEVGQRTIIGEPDGLWPLAAGRSVQFQTVNTRREDDREHRSVHFWSCAVRALERLETHAGWFEAFPIVCDRYSPNSMRVMERRTWHFAPEIGHYVRREERNMSDGERDSYALYSALPSYAANEVRLEALAQEALAANATQN